ncbi:MAG: 2-dehydro-3-deoxyglucarate aldolase [Verrucomicrobiaceae bacterium]|nr:2-dehydro-3-deoxyglucarate aldolase [Verrucomicrobiaceae bacterium]
MTPPSFKLGTWLSLGSTTVAELAADSGFDWLLFDLEHGSATDAAIPDQLRATRGSPIQTIVRVGAPHHDLIGRVLDWGAAGIMVPRVCSVDDAERIVKAAHYAPRGHRGVARTVRAVGYGLRPNDEKQMPRPKIIAQIETLDAVDQAAAIAAVDGIDVLFIGPADLGYDLLAQKSERSYADCVTRVALAARESGKECGILLRRTEDMAAMLELGLSWIAVDSDIGLIREGYKRIVAAAK